MNADSRVASARARDGRRAGSLGVADIGVAKSCMATLPSPTLRFGAFDAAGKRVATMLLNVREGTLSGSGSIDLQQAVQKALGDFQPPAEGDPEAVLADLLDKGVADLGLTVRRIADNDLVFKAEWDGSVGMIVGRCEVAEGAEPLSAETEKRLTESLANVGRRFADELASRIEKAALPSLAAAIVREAHAAGELQFEPTERLGDALASIDVDQLDEKEAHGFLPLRVMVASRLNRYGNAAADAEQLLSRWADHRPEILFEYRNIIAIGHSRAGRPETAISIWLKLAVETPDLPARQRGQILRNLAFAVPPSDSRAPDWIEQSADAYLQAGDRREAAISHVHWGDILEHHDTTRAVAMLKSARALLNEASLIGDALRAALLYALGRRLSALDRDAEALDVLLESVEMRRGLAGQEDELLASIGFAEKVARNLDDPRADALALESQSILKAFPNSRFSLSERIEQLLAEWDPVIAEELRTALETSTDLAAHIAVETTLLARDPALDAEARLAGLEALYESMIRRGASGEHLIPIRVALSHALQMGGAPQRAIPWLERILADEPLAEGIAEMLMDLLRVAEEWAKAAMVARREITLKGENYPRLMTLARFALAAGQADEGLRAALGAKGLTSKPDELAAAEKLVAIALGDGATLMAARAQPAIAAVPASAFEEALRGFAAQASSVYRMSYWERPADAKDYEWIASPERRAQDQLRLWLDAKFEGRVTTLEEIGTGAGRLDLLVQLAGGLQVIIELKMLGFRYSTTYAAKGGDQILHYLENRRIGLGYLVVFDARLQGNGTQLLEQIDEPGLTVREVLIDVRPRIEKRTSKAN